MKIKITFNEKEKEAFKGLITKIDKALDSTDTHTDALDKPDEDLFGPVKYTYDGEGALKIKIATKLTVMIVKFIGKLSKKIIKFAESIEEYWCGYEDAQLGDDFRPEDEIEAEIEGE